MTPPKTIKGNKANATKLTCQQKANPIARPVIIATLPSIITATPSELTPFNYYTLEESIPVNTPGELFLSSYHPIEFVKNFSYNFPLMFKVIFPETYANNILQMPIIGISDSDKKKHNHYPEHGFIPHQLFILYLHRK